MYHYNVALEKDSGSEITLVHILHFMRADMVKEKMVTFQNRKFSFDMYIPVKDAQKLPKTSVSRND